ncbi:hypothetical protein F2Q70_00039185 [Brassica cretica]|uniref:Uncharacterized protein n=1 Tax=Brassica cretica TaxID=69181 RepID=A0A8S9K1D3_BRACR|nr:hypothetical protein F2Q70_00039185 [Brassica cretica]
MGDQDKEYPVVVQKERLCGFIFCLSQGSKAGSGKEVRWAIEPDFIGRSNLDSIRIDELVFGAIQICSQVRTFVVVLIEVYELRMVLVKPRSREGSVNERLCNVWLDDARDELVIVYETVNKLCIGSHVSNTLDSRIVGLCSPHTQPADRSHGEAGKSKSGKVRKSKGTAGQTSQAATDGANLSGLPTDPVATNTGVRGFLCRIFVSTTERWTRLVFVLVYK